MSNKYDDACDQKSDTRLERERCLAAVDAEPELSDDIPPNMVRAIKKAMKDEDFDFFVHGMRLAVKMTKDGIRNRILSGMTQDQ